MEESTADLSKLPRWALLDRIRVILKCGGSKAIRYNAKIHEVKPGDVPSDVALRLISPFDHTDLASQGGFPDWENPFKSKPKR